MRKNPILHPSSKIDEKKDKHRKRENILDLK